MRGSECGGVDDGDSASGAGGGCFLADPSLFRDDLPQPFRRVSKILYENVFEDAWREISQRESDRIRQASRIRPPMYDCATPLTLADSSFRCLAVSPNGLYVFVGLSNGLAILSASTQKVEAIWREDGMEIIEAEMKIMSDAIILINCKDKQGFIRLFAFTNQTLLPLYVFSELEDSSQRSVVKSSISPAVDYFGICVLDKSSSQQPVHLVEVYKLPKDAWLTELEALGTRQDDQKRSSSKFDLAHLSVSGSGMNPTSLEMLSANSIVAATNCDPLEESLDLLPRLHSGSFQRMGASQKFSAPAMCLKLQHPNRSSTTTWNSPYQASKIVGADGDVIGIGTNHLISTVHMNNRSSIFKHQHHQYLNYLPKHSESSVINPLPSFHFLLPGKFSSQDSTSSSQTSTLAIWWSGDRHLMHYSVNKQAKAAGKPENVWSLSSPIVCSTVSRCSCLVALGLANKSVVIRDRFLGLPYKTLHIDDMGQISWICFVSPSSPDRCIGTEPVITLLALFSTGSIYTVICTSHSDPVATLVSTDILSDREIPSAIETIRGIPELILITRLDGRIFLHDIHQKNALCEVTLPNCNGTVGHSEDFSTVALTAASGKMLYVQRTNVKTEDGNEDANGSSCDTLTLYAVKLWLFPHLDAYLKENRWPLQRHLLCSRRAQNRLEKHISKTMQKRIEDQQNRKVRLQTRWFQMKEELSEKLKVKPERPTKA